METSPPDGNDGGRIGNPSPSRQKWYSGVTRYQWTVLAIASAGWVFDVFEGQIFVAAMDHGMMEDLLGAGATQGEKSFFKNVAFAAFLLGGALGGLIFGSMADKIGRRRAMTFTILMYSIFAGLTYFVQSWWDLAILRFLVAMGVGGEWAVAAAAVAEVFPQRSRPAASGIFHASSVLGTYLAVVAGLTVVVAHWRFGFLVGVAPALLVIWVRMSMRDPESWEAARAEALRDLTKRLGSFRDLFATPELRRNTLLGTALAAVGLATFWGVHIYGKNLVRQEMHGRYVEQEPRLKLDPGQHPDRREELAAVHAEYDARLQRWDMLGMLLVTTGGGLGLLAFAPITHYTNRRRAFLLYHLGGFLMAVVTFQFVEGLVGLLIVLPVFGFLTLGMHAGYAIYFPELFPTRLRGSGGGFCFNVGRVIAAPALLIGGAIQSYDLTGTFASSTLQQWESWGIVAAETTAEGTVVSLTLRSAVTLMSVLFFAGVVLIVFAPETKDRPLPS